MIKQQTLATLLVACALGVPAQTADWNQWRGPHRDGASPVSPPLLTRLPSSGLKPMWMATEGIPAARSGGWSSPIVAGGKVYLFAHKRERVSQGGLPAAKYPWLPPDKRTGMSEEEYAEYERKRRDEQEQRSKNYRFDEFVYCLDAQTGETLWRNSRESAYTRFAQSGSPAVVDGRLYVLGAGRMARCLDAVTGEDRWARQLPGSFRDEYIQSSFAIAEGVACVLCNQLFGLDAASGKILWQSDEETTNAVHSSPAVWETKEGTWFLANSGFGETTCVQPRSGKELWRVQSEAGHSTPVIVGDRLITYGNSRKKGLRCFTLTADGAEHLWTYQGLADPGSSPVVVGDYVYVQGERRLACVNLETGKAAWTGMLDLSRPRYTSLVAADKKVFYAFEGVVGFTASPARYDPWMNAKIDNTGLLAEEASFRKQLDIDRLETTAEGQKEADRLWRKKFDNGGPLPCASPAIVDGKLYLRLKNGLACYDLRTPSVDAGE